MNSKSTIFINLEKEKFDKIALNSSIPDRARAIEALFKQYQYKFVYGQTKEELQYRMDFNNTAVNIYPKQS